VGGAGARDGRCTRRGREPVPFRRRAYVSGGDPWNLNGSWLSFEFSGLPPTVLAFVPFALMPSEIVRISWVLISVIAAIYVVRRLHLQWWWLLFPPLVSTVWLGNPHGAALALILSGAAGLAPRLKVYAVVPLPLLAHWRPLLACAIVFVTTILIAPGLWAEYVANAELISARLIFQAEGFSAYQYPAIALLTAALLVTAFSRREIAWLLIPSLWPATSFLYSSLALPVAQPLLAGILAIPLRGSPVVAVVVVGALRLLVARRARLATIARPSVVEATSTS
jgi:hypothetical protein